MTEFFISDPHFGHRAMLKFEAEARPFQNIEDHDEWLVEQHNSVVGPDDFTWIGGDVVFTKRGQTVSHLLDRMNGKKGLILGNHDNEPWQWYAKHFTKIRGSHAVRSMGGTNVLITHFPIHPDEFTYRTDINLHGHIHGRKLVNDPRYINMCVEHCNAIPRTLEQWLRIGREPQIQ